MITLAKIAGRLASAARAGVSFKRVLALPDRHLESRSTCEYRAEEDLNEVRRVPRTCLVAVDEFLRGRDTHAHFLKVESKTRDGIVDRRTLGIVI
jgi:hypothetical protein